MHTIRLREPWQYQRLASGSDVFERRFHRPTGLDAASRVWLAVADLETQARIELNDQLIGEVNPDSCARHRFEITSLLKPQNLLSFTLTSPRPDDSARFIGQISLEIE